MSLSPRRLVAVAVAFAVGSLGLSSIPALAQSAPTTVPHLLVFTGTYGFRHDGIEEESAFLQQLARQTGEFTVEITGDPAVFTPALYQRIDGVVLLQTTGLGSSNSPLSTTQKQNFLDFFGCGGSLVGVHAAADSGGGWPAYDALLGSTGFDFHPHLSLEARENPLGPEAFNPSVLTDVTVDVDDPNHLATRPWQGFDNFRITEEIYRWKGNPRSDPNLHVLLSLDEESHYWRRSIGAGPSAGGMAPDFPNPVSNPFNNVPVTAFPDASPIAWVKPYGDHGARVFYTNLGHSMATWQRPDFQEHLYGGISWATASRPDAACVATRIG